MLLLHVHVLSYLSIILISHYGHIEDRGTSKLFRKFCQLLSCKSFQSVYTGFAVREMAFDLFGATRTSQHCSIVLSFQNSLQLSGFSPEICERWTIWCDSGLLDDLIIKPQVFFMFIVVNSIFRKI